MSEPIFTDKQKLDEIWRRGIVLPVKLHAAQKKIHAAVSASSEMIFVINSSRRLGKSFYLCCLAVQHAMQNPGSQIKFAAPNQKMVRKIITPLIKQILGDCPKHLRPRFKGLDGVYEFPNGSEISVAGTEMAQIDNLRGQACDLALIDEAGFATDLEYVLGSVIIPQTLTRSNARIILASTPPISPDHAFVKYAQEAMAKGAYAKFTIHDNPMLTPEKITQYMFESGGEKSTTWRREYLAEFVSDSDSALFPEADDDAMRDIVVAVEKPQFYTPITVADLGYIDFTGVLMAYYDFPNAKIVIEDEVLVNKTTSSEIVRQTVEKEQALWGKEPPKTRIVDANAMTIADMNELHRFSCRVPDKSDLIANVNRVRMDIADRRIIIHPRCVNLIRQLQFATWDSSRTRFSRSSSGGHWDLAAALVYLIKHIDRNHNPMPHGYGYDPYNTWGIGSKKPNSTVARIKSLFPTFNK